MQAKADRPAEIYQSRDDVLAEIKLLVAQHDDVPLAGLQEDTNLLTDLGYDSLDVVELVMNVEERFNIVVPDAEDGTTFQQDWFRSPPSDDPAEYLARSPLSHVRKIKTPLMLIEGESDFRTPPTAGGEMLFRALKYLKRPVVMVRFPNESHELSRSGNPWHRVERLRHIMNWFDKYLQGKPMPEYDPVPPEVKGGTSLP